MCSKLEDLDINSKTVGALPQDDVDQRSAARAASNSEVETKRSDDEIPAAKKRKRRRRNKRRHPYLNQDRKSSTSKVIKPEAPHNSNQFLIEDQGNSKQIDEQLRHDVGAGRTRDSSFSMDSDGEFGSTDEDAFLRKDFDDTYENLRTERLNLMSKTQLIEELLAVEKRFDAFVKQFKSKYSDMEVENLLQQLNYAENEVEVTKHDNVLLRNQILASNSESKDSESDSSASSSSGSSSSSSSARDVTSDVNQDESSIVDYTQTNGHSPSDIQVA